VRRQRWKRWWCGCVGGRSVGDLACGVRRVGKQVFDGFVRDVVWRRKGTFQGDEVVLVATFLEMTVDFFVETFQVDGTIAVGAVAEGSVWDVGVGAACVTNFLTEMELALVASERINREVSRVGGTFSVSGNGLLGRGARVVSKGGDGAGRCRSKGHVLLGFVHFPGGRSSGGADGAGQSTDGLFHRQEELA